MRILRLREYEYRRVLEALYLAAEWQVTSADAERVPGYARMLARARKLDEAAGRFMTLREKLKKAGKV